MTTPDLLHYPALDGPDLGIVRGYGPGLGNLLFSIARALIGQHRLGGRLVFPTIPQIKIGTFLRREKDKRTYCGDFRTRSLAEWWDWYSAERAAVIGEEDAEKATPQTGVIAYSGIRHCFHHLIGYQQLIRDWIDSTACYRRRVNGYYDIGVHVRMGDFAQADSLSNTPSVRTPTEWFREAISVAKHSVPTGRPPHIIIFSDEDQAVVRDMLGLPDAETDPSSNAITAIRNLSDSRLLITSRSTFSMWGAFLGNNPAIWHRDLDLATYFAPRQGLDTTLRLGV